MSLDELLPAIQRQRPIRNLMSSLAEGGSGRATLSVADAAKPYALAALHAALDRPLLLITARPGQARTLREEIACWHSRPEDVALFPEQDVLPYEPLAPDQETTSERLAVLSRLVESADDVTRRGGRG